MGKMEKRRKRKDRLAALSAPRANDTSLSPVIWLMFIRMLFNTPPYGHPKDKESDAKR